jgi:enolase-phosphatase E1
VTPRAIVTDIEGTTSSIRFVVDVLFPYSRARLAPFVRAQADELGAVFDAVHREVGDTALDIEAIIARLEQWHDADRKIAPLKTVQGLIWADGYACGAFAGHVYPDAVAGLRRWHARGIALYVYSSGSVAAQKLLFGHSEAGDLTPLFAGHFDTAIGAKRDAHAYRAIVAALGLPADRILFLSDVAEELAAAREAGLGVTLIARDGLPEASPFPVATGFDPILPD